MGSDMGGSKRNGKADRLRLLVAFFAGVISTFVMLPNTSSSSRVSNTSSSSNCAIYLGAYKGKEYRTATTTVGKPKCLVESRFLKVQQHAVQFENGGPLIDDWLWIDYHDRINVLVEVLDREEQQKPYFLVFEQTKYALEDRNSLAIVGGIIEPGEAPDAAARREVLEETAHACRAFDFLGRYRTDVNRGMGWTHAYLARDCKNTATATAEASKADEVGVADTEPQDLRTMSLEQVRKAVQAGEFLEIQWTATVALAMLQYDAAVK